MRISTFVFSAGLVASSSLFVACGSGNGNPGDGGHDAGTSDASRVDDSSVADSSVADSSVDASTTLDAATGPDLSHCTEIVADPFQLSGVDTGTAGYRANTTNVGTSTPDRLRVEFYSDPTFPGTNGANTGTFTLGTGGDANYDTCSRCVLFDQDDGDAASKSFFAYSGTMTIAPTSTQLTGNVDATLMDVYLVEVTIDASYHSTLVPGGACIHLANAPVAFTPSAPAGWKCDATYYDDESCDCGCGLVDPACTDANATSCDFCDDPGSCATACSSINAGNNAVCQ